MERALSVRAQTPKAIIQEGDLTFIVGQTPNMRRLLTATHKIAKKNITVLIQGETGQAKKYWSNILETLQLIEGFAFTCFHESLKHWSDQLNKKIIEKALEETYDNQIKAAKLLGLTPRALRYYLKK